MDSNKYRYNCISSLIIYLAIVGSRRTWIQPWSFDIIVMRAIEPGPGVTGGSKTMRKRQHGSPLSRIWILWHRRDYPHSPVQRNARSWAKKKSEFHEIFRSFAVAVPPGDETRDSDRWRVHRLPRFFFFFVANYSSTTHGENIKRVVWASGTTPHVRKRKTANRITVTRHVLRITTDQILRLHPPPE